jgi:hypothetical protein
MRCIGLVLLTACAGADAMTAPPAPAAARPTPANDIGLSPGETMAFELRLAGIVAGQAQLAVGALGDFEGHRAVVVKSRAETVGAAALIKHIVDEATTVVDMESGRPITVETLVEQGDNKITGSARFTGNIADITYARNGETTPHKQRIDFGAVTVHDAHTAMAQIRGWRPAPGATRSVFVVGGRRVWRVDMTYVGEDTIGSALGNRRAVRFTGQSYRTRRNLTAESDKPGRTFSVWLTDDADRVPLKVVARTELGEVAIDLTEYNR